MNAVTVVLAGNYREFRRWCAENGLSPDDRALLYPDRPEKLQGTAVREVVRVGTWHLRRDGREIESMATLRMGGPPDV